jgi:hypothetical protein
LALTAVKVQNLTDKGFVDLFSRHRALWEAKVREAYEYTEVFVTNAGLPVRPDDVIDLLVPALELSDEFRTFLDEKRLRQKYWRIQFGELIIDEFWPELTGEEAENDQADGGQGG